VNTDQMREVTKDEFYKVIGPLNVHPSTELEMTTLWRMKYTRLIVGVSLPGWKNPGDEAKYFLPETQT
jgi:hypothetical protein